jgi:hypothetical protein
VQVVAIGEGEKLLRSLFLAERFWPLAGSAMAQARRIRFAGAGKFRNAALRNAFGVTSSTSRSN